ncbi:fibronectin type III domain-containing protein [Patescibacteria group bacterium]|nr:fibronectin type III domain-containing protein [Patescibacteria group bacterium]
MTKKSLIILLISAFTLSIFSVNIAIAADDHTGQVVKVEGSSTLYYVATDGKLYVFPNEKTYKSWDSDFDDVVTITQVELSEFTIGGNIRYRPGVLLVKFTNTPKVYAVSQNGKLRWVKTERIARKLYGENWNKLIDDIPLIFFPDYVTDNDINDEGDYDPDEEINSTETIENNKGFALGHYKDLWKSNTTKCRATAAVPHGQGKKATPAVSARQCKINLINDAQKDETAPVITNVVVTPSNTSAVITWTTDEESNSTVEYATESLSTATSTETVTDSDLVTSHSLELNNLTAETTYYYIVKSADSNSNIATTTESTFTTTAQEVDITAPIISDIFWQISTTTATVEWETNEASTSKITYALESLNTVTSTEEVSSTDLVTSHSLDLSGLSSYTTYYYILESIDAATNTATTTETTFITTLGIE